MTRIFNSEDNTLKDLGETKSYKIVSYQNDGLVSPDLINTLGQINDLSDIRLTSQKPYFYLFHSGDNLLEFTLSNPLRLEINRPYLFRKLTSIPYVGSVGQKGPMGPIGSSGRPAINERFIITNQNGKFNTKIATPIDTPISLRGFLDNKQEFEIIIPLNGEIPSNQFFIDLSFNNNHLSGTLLDTKYKIKARQIGPSGPAGLNGNNAVNVNEIEVNNTQFESFITNLRKRRNILSFRRSEESFLNCVFSLSPVGRFEKADEWVATEVTTKQCKDILWHEPVADPQKPSLEIPSWTALSGCYDSTRYEIGYLNWLDGVEFPFNIIEDPKPKAGGCKEPFWFCASESCDANINIEIEPELELSLSDLSTSSSSSSSSFSRSESSSQSFSSSNSESTSLSEPTSESESTLTSASSESQESQSSPSSVFECTSCGTGCVEITGGDGDCVINESMASAGIGSGTHNWGAGDDGMGQSTRLVELDCTTGEITYTNSEFSCIDGDNNTRTAEYSGTATITQSCDSNGNIQISATLTSLHSGGTCDTCPSTITIESIPCEDVCDNHEQDNIEVTGANPSCGTNGTYIWDRADITGHFWIKEEVDFTYELHINGSDGLAQGTITEIDKTDPYNPTMLHSGDLQLECTTSTGQIQIIDDGMGGNDLEDLIGCDVAVLTK